MREAVDTPVTGCGSSSIRAARHWEAVRGGRPGAHAGRVAAPEPADAAVALLTPVPPAERDVMRRKSYALDRETRMRQLPTRS